MNLFAASLSVGAAITGVIAAFYWFRASRKASASEMLDMLKRPDDLMEVYWQLRTVHSDAWLAAKFNRIAAIWTAASVLCAGAASLISSLSN